MKSRLTNRLALLASLVALAACQNPSPSLTEPASSPVPPATSTPAEAVVASGPLAPDGAPGESYYAPFPVAITLDGNLDDWEGVPAVALPEAFESAQGATGLNFAAAADDRFLYLSADVSDANVVTGQHYNEYWNEDSVEFYINATGNLELTAYQEGIAQITIPPLNMERAPDDAIISGVRGEDAQAQAVVAPRAGGYIVEMAVPLQNDVWDISPEHGGVLGFQVHLNGASQADRDLKLIWSKRDTNDTSYQNPSVFGELIFYEIGQSSAARIAPQAPPTPVFIPVAADAVYKQADAPIADRVEDLLAHMTLAEKIGQMTQVEKNSITPDAVRSQLIGSLLSGGGGYPTPNTPEAWRDMVADFQEAALSTRLGIPLIYGVDAVHGHNNVQGATIFPHNVGLGATQDPDLVARVGQATAQEMVATGICWDFAPVIAVAQDIRWGRTYEAYGEDTELASSLGVAFLQGLQGESLADPGSVLATPKHYVGDGATSWGTSQRYLIDQGDALVDEDTLRSVHLPPYQAAIDGGARSIMVSFSSWQGTKLHGHSYLLTDVLKEELGFDGFLVSDWQGIDQIPGGYNSDVVTAINAGVDMVMVPYDYQTFIQALTRAVENGDVPMARIDDAVARILRVKFELGLFEEPLCGDVPLETVGSPENRALAREAVAKSLVLLKNDGVLPLAKDTPLLFVGGAAADDIGIQSGGWTIEWQGRSGDITPGTTILQGIQAAVAAGATVAYDRLGKFEEVPGQADLGIAVIGERPYAEGEGDDDQLRLSRGDLALIETMRERSQKLVVVLVSGRPLIITDLLDQADAVVAAWLPGTEGDGVAEVLFGDRPFTGKLPYTWPRTADQLPFDFANLPDEGCDAPLFWRGYGLEASQSGPLELPDCGDEENAEVAGSPAMLDSLSLLDDFEDGQLPAGQDQFAQIGYITWSDGSPVSIDAVQVAESDDLSLPDQAGANTVLRLNTDIKSSGWGGFSNAFAGDGLDTWTSQDWSAYEGIALWLYGNGTGGTLFVDILDNRNPDSRADDAERWTYDILDDFEGWLYIQIPFEHFRRKEIGNGAPNDGLNLTEVHGYAVGAFGSAPMGPQSNYVDQLALYGQAPERPVEISFERAAIGVRETGRATVRVKLNKAAEQPVTVDYAVAEGAALAGRDYEPTGGTLAFAPGETEQSFQFQAIDDAKAEGQEKLSLVLTNPTNAELGFQRRVVVTIRDDETADPNLLLDFDQVPPLRSSEGVQISLVEMGQEEAEAVPGQEGYENLLAVTYGTADDGPQISRVYGEPQDWREHDGLSFWFYGSGSGDTFTLELLGSQVATTADLPSEEWELAWSDEFDGPAGAPADPAIWQPEIGDGTLNGIPGWGNSELETYTASPDNAAMDGLGNLVITARQVDPDNADLVCWYGACRYTSARLITRDRAEFQYGRIEARMKLPQGQGLWPAFWMLGSNLDQVGWPQSGEIDVMEHVGREPDTVHGTIHGPGYSGGSGIGASYDSPEGAVADGFHVYAVEWTPEQIRWFVDDGAFFAATPDDLPGDAEWVFDQPFFLILNVAVGGNWPGDPNESTTFPQAMIVDYVRVYGAPDTAQRYETFFTDDLAGWQQVVLPFFDFRRSIDAPVDANGGGPDLEEVWGYILRMPADGSGTFYMDKLRLE